jgi:signal transduction histidine kinase/CheY-like chemotaxis protein
MPAPFFQSLAGELLFNVTAESLPIRTDQVRARLRLFPVLVLSQLFLEPLFVALFWEQAEHSLLLGWLLFLYSIHTIEMFLWWRYATEINTADECKQWSRIFNYSTVLISIAWGSIALWFFPVDLAYQALMICIILGLVAGSVSLNSVYPPALYIYVVGVTSPMLFSLIKIGDQLHLTLAIMLLLFLVGALSAGRELSKTFWKSLWQRYENDQLIEQLTIQKALSETANRDKSRFLASASHDLRQPLQALVLFSDALENLAKDQDTQYLAVQIGNSVTALVDMFDELLDISKFDAGVVHTVKQHFQLQPMLDRLKNDYLHLAQAKDLEFILPETNLTCYSDPNLLERILRNLISNAIRYTDIGMVSVNCESIGGELHFAVTDTGIGIRAESMPHIFEEYYQVDNQHRDRLKGLGLGLAIVRRMEALLGCRVNVASKPSQGSTFSFILPLGNASQIQQSSAPHQTRNDMNGVTVALIDDNRDIRQMAATLMQQWGCQVHEGELPQDVLQQMSAAGLRPDIVICDHRLPQGKTSRDAIRLLKAIWTEDIPTLVLTGDTAPQTLLDIKASGALLLHKPIAPARLRSIMYFLLHNEAAQLAD